MRSKRLFSVLGLAALIAAPDALAHHSFAAQFDANKPVTIEGYLAKNGTNTCNARRWIYEGRPVFAGSADGGPPR